VCNLGSVYASAGGSCGKDALATWRRELDRSRLKVDRRREDGWRGGKTGMVRKGVKRTGGLERHHPLCGGNKLKNPKKLTQSQHLKPSKSTSYGDRARPSPANERVALSAST